MAGVDKATLDECPASDKIWATHIGAMLIFTFVVIAGITYLSFDYLGSIATTIDETTNKVSYTQIDRTGWSVLIGVVLALIIALIVTLFDRAIFISDWFFQPVYGESKRPSLIGKLLPTVLLICMLSAILFWGPQWLANQKIVSGEYISGFEQITPYLWYGIFAVAITGTIYSLVLFIFDFKKWSASDEKAALPEPSFIKKIFRVLIRFTISLFIAFALSTFLELRIYETNIFAKLSEWHFEQNEAIYSEYSTRIDEIDTSLGPFEKSVENAQTAVDNLTQASSGDISQALSNIDSTMDDIRTQYGRDEAALVLERNNARTPILNRLNDAQDQLLRTEQERSRYLRRETDELSGTNDLNDSNASGVAGEGRLSRSARGHAAALLVLINTQKDEVERLTEELRVLDELYSTRLSTLNAAYEENRNLLSADKQAIIDGQNTSSDDLEIQLTSAQARLNLAVQALDSAREAQVIDFKTARQTLLENPEFRPLQAGPLERLQALKAIKDGDTFGEIITQYALILKVFVIFLEVIPVATKMFFSPPSVYASRVQANTYIATRKELDRLSKHLRERSNNILDQQAEYLKKYASVSDDIITLSAKQKERLQSIRAALNDMHEEEIRIATNVEFHEEFLRSMVQELVDEIFAKSEK